MKIKILNSGLLTTIQDMGRYGFQNQGIVASGAMDMYSMRLSNILVGNREHEGVIEITLMGPSVYLEKGTLFCITGGDLSPSIDDKSVPMYRPVYMRKDGILKFGKCRYGCRSYLAAAGGYDVPKVMKSKSTYLSAEIGGFHGRALSEGDVVKINSEKSEESVNIIKRLSIKTGTNKNFPFISSNWYVDGGSEYKNHGVTTVRVIEGKQFKYFTYDSIKRFFNSIFQITSKSDRMGCRLKGYSLKSEKYGELISEAVSFGTIQVPSDGNPIILMADRQTTGGYPKIAQAAYVDLSKIAQLKSGDKIRFQKISVEDAEKSYFERERYIRRLSYFLKIRGNTAFL